MPAWWPWRWAWRMTCRAPTLTKALTAEVSQLPPEKQVYVIEALGVRRDKSVVPTLLALTKNSPPNVLHGRDRRSDQTGGCCGSAPLG